MKKLALFTYMLFACLVNSAFGQNAPMGEAKNLERVILKSLTVPYEYLNTKKANVFAVKFMFSADNKLTGVFASKQAPETLIKRLVQPSVYEKIDWSKLRKGGGNNALVVVITVFPDEKSGFTHDKSETIPYFTHPELDDLFNFRSNSDQTPLEILPFTIQSAYSGAIH